MPGYRCTGLQPDWPQDVALRVRKQALGGQVSIEGRDGRVGDVGEGSVCELSQILGTFPLACHHVIAYSEATGRIERHSVSAGGVLEPIGGYLERTVISALAGLEAVFRIWWQEETRHRFALIVTQPVWPHCGCTRGGNKQRR